LDQQDRESIRARAEIYSACATAEDLCLLVRCFFGREASRDDMIATLLHRGATQVEASRLVARYTALLKD
jgi:hypothetical protein